ncbi:MAG: C4-dicarboxylate transporter DctA, partial [Corynebacterium striatum]|nr:C4-dicarboxylate transporter DctA [Corynebacterium striatum]
TKTVDMDRVTKVLNGEEPYADSGKDSTVNLRMPDVENPAHDRLQPTQQVDLERYKDGSEMYYK